MAKFNIEIQHQLERDVVVTKLRSFSDEMRERVMVQVSEVTEEWDDQGNLNFSFRAMGFTVSGQMVTCEKQVTVFGDLPFAALPFRGAIQSQVEQKIRDVIA